MIISFESEILSKSKICKNPGIKYKNGLVRLVQKSYILVNMSKNHDWDWGTKKMAVPIGRGRNVHGKWLQSTVYMDPESKIVPKQV